MRQVAIYGKGGIGKSTTTQNTVAALAEAGKQIMVVGCDPKADSTRLLLHGLCQKTVLDTLRDEGDDIDLDDILKPGFAQNPLRGIRRSGTRRRLRRAAALSLRSICWSRWVPTPPTWIMCSTTYWATLVCGGFAMPIREGKAEEIYIVASGELMALYAANNIAKGVQKYATNGKVRLGGIICNSRKVDNEYELLKALRRGNRFPFNPLRPPRQSGATGRN